MKPPRLFRSSLFLAIPLILALLSSPLPVRSDDPHPPGSTRVREDQPADEPDPFAEEEEEEEDDDDDNPEQDETEEEEEIPEPETRDPGGKILNLLKDSSDPVRHGMALSLLLNASATVSDGTRGILKNLFEKNLSVARKNVKDPETRRVLLYGVILYLGRIHHTDMIEPFRQRYSSEESWLIRAGICAALGEMGVDSREVLQTLGQALEDPDSSVSARAAASISTLVKGAISPAFDPAASEAERSATAKKWREWLSSYQPQNASPSPGKTAETPPPPDDVETE